MQQPQCLLYDKILSALRLCPQSQSPRVSLRAATSRRILWFLVDRATLKARVPYTQGAAVHKDAQWLVPPGHRAPVETGALWKVRKHRELCRSSPQLHP